MTDIAALVGRLRWHAASGRGSPFREAADALEALQARAEKAEAEIEQLRKL